MTDEELAALNLEIAKNKAQLEIVDKVMGMLDGRVSAAFIDGMKKAKGV